MKHGRRPLASKQVLKITKQLGITRGIRGENLSDSKIKKNYMSNIPTDATIYDYIAHLGQRVSNLETGGRRIVRVSEPGNAQTTLAPNNWVSFSVKLTWPDLTYNPHANFYYALYVDGQTSDDIWPYGSNLNSNQRDLVFSVYGNLVDLDEKTSSEAIYLKNTDTNTHTYYLEVGSSYISGQTGEGGQQTS